MTPNIKMMSDKKKQWIRWTGIIFIVLGLLIFGSIAGIDYVVDIWWFNALGYELYYWQRVLYSYTIFFGVTLLFFGLFYFNLRIAARFLTNPSDAEPPEDESTVHAAARKARKTKFWYVLISLLLSIAIALPVFRHWDAFLFYLFGRHTGAVDPYFGRDVTFYLFSYPIYTLIQRRLLMAFGILAAGLFSLYVLKNRRLKRPLLSFRRGDGWHLSIVVALLAGLGIWDFMLQRYGLLYHTGHKDLFYGPGFAEMHVVLPMLWICMVTLGLAAIAVIIMIQRRKGYIVTTVLLLFFLGTLALRSTSFLTGLVQAYMVKPNELDKESSYIEKHVEATLDAYKLTDPDVRIFTHTSLPKGKTAAQMDAVLRNVPVWDAETLEDVFQQLQELRTYYQFPVVNVGRYKIDGRQQQVFLSPREIEFSNLPGEVINWINQHMTYTHGFGLVMTPASQIGGDTMTWYVHNIPPESAYDLVPDQPRIYYGLGKYTYSIVPNQTGEMDYPKGSGNVLTSYDGRGGIPISSVLRKSLLAYAFKNKNIFFSTEMTGNSKLLFRRNIIERITHIAPFLLLDETPYLAATHKGMYWIVDAYTTSTHYPASAPRQLGNTSFNYIRNSVKIVVDAYHGSVEFYIYDTDDPIIKAYDNIYPGLFKSKDEMPEELKSHVRYPKDYFDIQMRIYARYHQTNPHVYYQQEDLWTFGDKTGGQIIIPLSPYYVTLDLIESGKMDFLLLLPMFPKNRDNLRAVAVGGCDPEHYGKIVIYDFPKGQLFYGPAQIDALINQDPEIAEQFTLWDQAGSTIVRGKMIILLVGNSTLFIQPVYLKATSRVKIPELQRIIMSEGEVVVMEKTVQAAYAALKKRAAPVMPPTQIKDNKAPDKPEASETGKPASKDEKPEHPIAVEKEKKEEKR